jgi:hypothetical protein
VLLSPQEYDRLRALNTDEFQRFCDRIGERAAARGMSEENWLKTLPMKARERVVIDTNALISRLLLPGSVPGRAVRKAVAEALLASDDTMNELADVLARAKLDPASLSENDRNYCVVRTDRRMYPDRAYRPRLARSEDDSSSSLPSMAGRSSLSPAMQTSLPFNLSADRYSDFGSLSRSLSCRQGNRALHPPYPPNARMQIEDLHIHLLVFRPIQPIHQFVRGRASTRPSTAPAPYGFPCMHGTRPGPNEQGKANHLNES